MAVERTGEFDPERREANEGRTDQGPVQPICQRQLLPQVTGIPRGELAGSDALAQYNASVIKKTGQNTMTLCTVTRCMRTNMTTVRDGAITVIDDLQTGMCLYALKNAMRDIAEVEFPPDDLQDTPPQLPDHPEN